MSAAPAPKDGNGMKRLEEELKDETSKAKASAARAREAAEEVAKAGEGTVAAANRVIESAKKPESRKFRITRRK